jgi:hypothetical protein
MVDPNFKPFLFRGGAVRLASLLASRNGVVFRDGASTPNPSSEEEGL